MVLLLSHLKNLIQYSYCIYILKSKEAQGNLGKTNHENKWYWIEGDWKFQLFKICSREKLWLWEECTGLNVEKHQVSCEIRGYH